MNLRAFALLFAMTASPMAGAAEAFFHLCGDAARLSVSCCCGHQTADVPEPESSNALAAEMAVCCDPLAIPAAAELPATTVQTSAADSLFAIAAGSVLLPLAPVASLLPLARTVGLHRATAPPLYVQNCSYLI